MNDPFQKVGADEVLVRTTANEAIRLSAVGTINERLAQLDAAIASQRAKLAALDTERASRSEALQKLIAMKAGTWAGMALLELVAWLDRTAPEGGR